ncbi:interleukin-31 receptor subunit alpha [Rhinoderma darwinii]|uniref:interleukin-31 receptor subunit alpha n=1 Tax=Rhinoderma darwinii TaxID=43563 RepID=UPI003F6689BC
MFCYLPWLLTILSAATQITDAGAAIYGRIFPKVTFILKGSNSSFYCKLNTTGLIEDVYWTLSTDVAPGSGNEIVNATVIKVTIPNLSADTVKVTCLIHTSNPQQLDEIDIISGYPPETPKNISCIYFYKQNVTCKWIPAKDTKIPTTFHLTVSNSTEQNCSTMTNSCFFLVGREQFGSEYNVQLQVENGLGKAASKFTVNTAKLVGIDPPEVLSLKPLPAKDPSFLISWRRPTLAPDGLDLKCSLQYKPLQSDQWNYTPDLYMEKEKEMSHNLSGLLAYTEYAVSLRCIGDSGQLFWSEWSGERRGRTAEQAPTHNVELWRVISCTNHTRLVYLRWRERSSIRSTGITQGYNIQWFPEDRTFDSRNKTTNNNEMMINISDEAYIISVVYFNSAGWSPKATLRIPVTGEHTQAVISGVQVSTAAEDTTVTWTVTHSHFQRFVVDWCLDLGAGLCNTSFQYVENLSNFTIKKGILEPYKRYKISVYPILEDRVGAPFTTHFYTKEGAPLYGPNVKLENRKTTEATIRWDPLRPEDTNGFITAFTIVYGPPNGYESVVTVDSDVYEYSLRSLMPSTIYSAYVVASTSAGNKSGNHIQFLTLAESSEYIGTLAGILGTCLFLMLVLGLTYKYKKDKIKNLFWPNVPDPSHSSVSEWSSDWLQGVQHLEPVRTDGTLHAGDLHILHAAYVNDNADRKLLFPDTWGSSDPEASMDKSSIVMHYTALENCMLLHSALWPAPVGSGYSQSSLHGSRTAGAEETPPDLELFYTEDTAAVNPYLKNSVRTREALHISESVNR